MSVTINGVDVDVVLVVFNVLNWIGWPLQWAYFVILARRVISHNNLSRMSQALGSASGSGGPGSNLSNQISNTASPAAPCETAKSGEQSQRQASPMLSKKQRTARTKLVLTFFLVFFGSIRAIDVCAIFLDDWALARWLIWMPFGIVATAYLVVFLHQHCVTLYLTHIATNGDVPKWVSYARDGFIYVNAVWQTACAIALATTRRYYFDGVSRIFYSGFLFTLSILLAIFVFSITRQMKRYWNHGVNTYVDKDRAKHSQVLMKMQRFGYGISTMLFVIGIVNTVPLVDILDDPLRPLSVTSQFGPRELRIVDLNELHFIWSIFVFTIVLQISQWVGKNPRRQQQGSRTKTPTPKRASRTNHELAQSIPNRVSRPIHGTIHGTIHLTTNVANNVTTNGTTNGTSHALKVAQARTQRAPIPDEFI